jgi:hypothetical protein
MICHELACVDMLQAHFKAELLAKLQVTGLAGRVHCCLLLTTRRAAARPTPLARLALWCGHRTTSGSRDSTRGPLALSLGSPGDLFAAVILRHDGAVSAAPAACSLRYLRQLLPSRTTPKPSPINPDLPTTEPVGTSVATGPSTAASGKSGSSSPASTKDNAPATQRTYTPHALFR